MNNDALTARDLINILFVGALAVGAYFAPAPALLDFWPVALLLAPVVLIFALAGVATLLELAERVFTKHAGAVTAALFALIAAAVYFDF